MVKFFFVSHLMSALNIRMSLAWQTTSLYVFDVLGLSGTLVALTCLGRRSGEGSIANRCEECKVCQGRQRPGRVVWDPVRQVASHLAGQDRAGQVLCHRRIFSSYSVPVANI